MSGEMIERPEWMVSVPKEEWGTDELSNYVVPPRMKVLQALSADELIEQFDVGTVIAMPQKVKVCDKGASFIFTPIYFFAEWIGWNPLGTKPEIRERSLDPTSSTARKAKQLAVEVVDGGEVTYCEHLNYVVVLHDHAELKQTPVVISFSRGEHRMGTNLSGLIKMRPPGPLYANKFVGTSESRSNQKGKWWGISVNNPVDDQYVTEEQFNTFRQLHNSYKEAAIQVNYSDANTVEAEDSKDTEF